MDRIEAIFQWLKANLGINKTELYKRGITMDCHRRKSKTEIYRVLNKQKGKGKKPNNGN